MGFWQLGILDVRVGNRNSRKPPEFINVPPPDVVQERHGVNYGKRCVKKCSPARKALVRDELQHRASAEGVEEHGNARGEKEALASSSNCCERLFVSGLGHRPRLGLGWREVKWCD